VHSAESRSIAGTQVPGPIDMSQMGERALEFSFHPLPPASATNTIP
jgi:hypothetical protein